MIPHNLMHIQNLKKNEILQNSTFSRFQFVYSVLSVTRAMYDTKDRSQHNFNEMVKISELFSLDFIIPRFVPEQFIIQPRSQFVLQEEIALIALHPTLCLSLGLDGLRTFPGLP